MHTKFNYSENFLKNKLIFHDYYELVKKILTSSFFFISFFLSLLFLRQIFKLRRKFFQITDRSGERGRERERGAEQK
jgi:hypothetical protein